MKNYGMAVVGLGVVGRRMLEQAARHGGFRIVSAFDTSAEARAAAARDFPDVALAADAAEAIARDGVDLVYVAVPPLAHAHHVRMAIAAGRAVLCEKPLGVDLAESAALVEEVAASGVAQAVNFVFASSAAVDALHEVVREPGFELRSVAIDVRFHQWPRAWQASAGWLRHSAEGGFTREVLSHFVYLLHRVLGPVSLQGAACQAGAGAGESERAVAAVLTAGGVPISMSGSVGGQPPDVVEARFVGAQRELRLVDWFRLVDRAPGSGGGTEFPGLPADPRNAAFQAQLDQLHSMLSGRPHTLADFASALAVQRVVESMLEARPTNKDRT